MSDFASTLRATLDRQGITQAELASAVGVTERCVSNWVRGAKEPRLSLALRVADKLALSLDALISPTDARTNVRGTSEECPRDAANVRGRGTEGGTPAMQHNRTGDRTREVA